MLFAVSFSNGIAGVFTSIEKVSNEVFNKYLYIPFIIQVYKQINENSEYAWIILYNSDNIAYVTDDKDMGSKYDNYLHSIGKSYNESIDYWEVKLNQIIPASEIILEHLNNAHRDTTPIKIDSSKSILYYC